MSFIVIKTNQRELINFTISENESAHLPQTQYKGIFLCNAARNPAIDLIKVNIKFRNFLYKAKQ